MLVNTSQKESEDLRAIDTNIWGEFTECIFQSFFELCIEAVYDILDFYLSHLFSPFALKRGVSGCSNKCNLIALGTVVNHNAGCPIHRACCDEWEELRVPHISHLRCGIRSPHHHNRQA
jgi:hypothetical protein